MLSALKLTLRNMIKTSIEHKSTVDSSTIIRDKLPVVMITGGVATSGKDLLVSELSKYLTVYKTSSINCIRAIASELFDRLYQDYKLLQHNIPVSRDFDHMLQGDIEYLRSELKTPEFRSFLHDIKSTYIKHGNGPNIRTTAEIYNLIVKDITGINETHTNVVIVDIREPDQIATFIRLMLTLGVVPITVFVDRGIDPAKFKNNGDSTTHQYGYDVYVDNTGTVEELQDTIEYMANAIIQFQDIAGISHGAFGSTL